MSLPDIVTLCHHASDCLAGVATVIFLLNRVLKHSGKLQARITALANGFPFKKSYSCNFLP
jgi:hypothetical protein